MKTNISSPMPQSAKREPTTNLNELVEQIWHDLHGQSPRSRIHQVVAEVAASFGQATVTSFLPVFIRRYTLETLRTETDLGRSQG